MEQLLIEIAKYIRPELSILLIVSFCVGYWLKNISTLNNMLIPLILAFMCILLAVGYMLVATVINGWRDILLVVLCAITQGILISFSAMALYDIWSKTGKYLIMNKVLNNEKDGSDN